MNPSSVTTAVLLLGAILFPTRTEPPAPERADLVRGIELALDAPGWDEDHWSVLVVSLDGGDTLYSRNPEVARVPASNLKLFTTAAALDLLGPDYRFSTFLTATGRIRGGVLDGDLHVYGTGDPTLSGRFFPSRMAVWEALADSLEAAGVQRIAGDLVGDASYFEGSSVGRGWHRSYATHTYAAPATALAYNDNVVTLRIMPADTVGYAPEIQVVRGGTVALEVEAETTPSGRSHVWLERADYTQPAVLRGTVRQGTRPVWRAMPVADPARFAVSVFREVLRGRGIQVAGQIRSEYSAETSPITGHEAFAPAAEDAVIQVLAVHRSPPLLEILKVTNQRSHNLYADAVLRAVGRMGTGHGSVQGGQAAVRALLARAGLHDADVQMDDGSGLSRLDRASAGSIVRLLAYMAASSDAEAYRATLPEAATTRGLRRMYRTAAAGNLRAKTGTIRRVSALSGYVRAQNGERLAFSILSNSVPSTWMAKRVEDRIGTRLAEFDRAIRAPGVGVPDPDPDVRATSRYYTIRPGDTFEAIARQAGTTVAELREANPGVEPRRLIPGRTLRLPTDVPGGV